MAIRIDHFRRTIDPHTCRRPIPCTPPALRDAPGTWATGHNRRNAEHAPSRRADATRSDHSHTSRAHDPSSCWQIGRSRSRSQPRHARHCGRTRRGHRPGCPEARGDGLPCMQAVRSLHLQLAPPREKARLAGSQRACGGGHGRRLTGLVGRPRRPYSRPTPRWRRTARERSSPAATSTR